MMKNGYLLIFSCLILSCAGTAEDSSTQSSGSVLGALSLQATSASGSSSVIHCEDFDGNTVGTACETGDSDTCTITGLTSAQLSAGLVCVGRGQDWRGAAGFGKPYHVAGLLTSDEVASVEAGTLLDIPIDTETSFAYAAALYVCDGGLSDCAVETASLQDLMETLGNLPDESGSERALSLGTVFISFEDLFTNSDDDTDPAALLYSALNGSEDPFNAYLDTPLPSTDFANVVEVLNRILEGLSPYGEVPCTDAESCAALYDGSCNPGMNWDLNTSYNYSHLIDYGLDDSTIVLLSEYSDEGDSCLTMKALSQSCNLMEGDECETTVRCYDEASCETRYAGPCNPPDDIDNSADDSSWSYSDLIAEGATMEQIACLSAFTERVDACVTVAAILASENLGDPCEVIEGGGIGSDEEDYAVQWIDPSPADDTVFTVDALDSTTIFTLAVDYVNDPAGVQYLFNYGVVENTFESIGIEEPGESVYRCANSSTCSEDITGYDITGLLVEKMPSVTAENWATGSRCIDTYWWALMYPYPDNDGPLCNDDETSCDGSIVRHFQIANQEGACD